MLFIIILAKFEKWKLFIQFNARKKIIKRSTNVFERKHSDKMILL